MRKADVEVREVVCSETGKPMAKIPLWMADVRVKFVSDEARQKHPSPQSLSDIEPLRRGLGATGEIEELKSIDEAVAVIEDDETEFEEPEAEEPAEEYVEE